MPTVFTALWRLTVAMLTNLARLALLAMLFLTVLDIGGRYLFDHPLEGTTAIITQLLFPALVFLSLARSEEHTSELQSLMRISYAVFCLKKKKKTTNTTTLQQAHKTM